MQIASEPAAKKVVDGSGTGLAKLGDAVTPFASVTVKLNGVPKPDTTISKRIRSEVPRPTLGNALGNSGSGEAGNAPPMDASVSRARTPTVLRNVGDPYSALTSVTTGRKWMNCRPRLVVKSIVLVPIITTGSADKATIAGELKGNGTVVAENATATKASRLTASFMAAKYTTNV